MGFTTVEAAVTAFRTCTGCILQGQPCEARATLREKLKGLGITSVKWRCTHRTPKYQIGDPVWASTIADTTDADIRDDFPGLVIENAGNMHLILIEPGVRGQDDAEFIPSGNGSGFCKIPLSRLRPRNDADREKICSSCKWPARKGHQAGYLCAVSHNPDEDKRRSERGETS